MLRWMNRSTAGGKSRAEKIAAMVEKIARSDLSVDEFFRRYTVPFSRPQYFRYQARLAAQGLAGLLDGRRQGNRRKLTPEAEAFLRGAHQSNPQRSLQEMCQSLYATLGIEVDRSTVGRFLHRVGESIVWPRPQEPERVTTSGGGFEILAALALHLGWVAHTAEVIAHSLARFRRSAAYRQERVGKDRKGRRAGRFTVAYNQRRDVREQRFASVEEKREDKNYSRMGLFQVSGFILERKCLGILAFPLITLNGGTRSANVPAGAEVLGAGRRSAARPGGVLAGALAEAGREFRASLPVLLRGRQHQGAVVAKAGQTEQSDDAGAGHGLSGAGVRA